MKDVAQIEHLMKIEQTLKQHFGFETFWAGQREIVEQVLAGRDAFVLMPTGGGKSLTYQLPALLMPGLTIVISPLIALICASNGRLAHWLKGSPGKRVLRAQPIMIERPFGSFAKNSAA